MFQKNKYSCWNTTPRPSRNIFQKGEALPAPQAPEGKIEKGKEAGKATSEDAEAKNTELQLKKTKLQQKINEGLQSENAEVKAEAQKAQEQLNAAESKNLEPGQIDGYINKMHKILQFGKFKGNLEKNKAAIKEFLSTRKKEIKEAFDAKLNEIMKEYPDLSPEVKNRLTATKTNHLQQLIQAYDEEYKHHLTTTISLDQFLTDIKGSAEKHNEVKIAAQEIGKAHTGAFNEIYENYERELGAVVEMEKDIKASKDAKESENHINSETERLIKPFQEDVDNIQLLMTQQPDRKMELMSQLEKAQNQIAEIKMVQQESLAMLAKFNKPEDAEKRAMALAKFKDDTGTIRWGPNFNPKYLKAATSSGGMEKDAVAKAFERGISKIDTNDPDVLDAKGKKLKIGKNVDFRMEDNGVKLSTLKPGTEIQLADTQVYYFETDKEEIIAYVKVQLDPPNGPVGYVEKNSAGIAKPLPAETERIKEEEPLKVNEEDKESISKMKINTPEAINIGDEIIVFTRLGPGYYEINGGEKAERRLGSGNLQQVLRKAEKFAEEQRNA